MAAKNPDLRGNVPADCTASQDPAENAHALAHMHRVPKADIRPSTDIDFRRVLTDATATRGGRLPVESRSVAFPDRRKIAD